LKPELDHADPTDSERMAISAVDRFDTLIRDLDDVANTLKANLVLGHELLASLAGALRDAKDATKRLAREEVRKSLAKEAEAMAAELRSQIKADRAK